MLHIDETPVKVGILKQIRKYLVSSSFQKSVLGNCNLISDWENDSSAQNKTLVYTLAMALELDLR